jgi:hypothetical protein
MEAKELRIGNWVNSWRISGDWIPKQIESGKEIDFVFMQEENIIYKPIQLTEEWLLKMGFEKDDNYYTSYRLDEGYITVKAEDNDWDDLCLDVFIKTADMDKEFYLTAIEHVHSLQNLYFALTGEELTIKDN